MAYLASSANLQLTAFFIGSVGWIFSSVITGLLQWRVWYFYNSTVITSEIAWVGIWRACFFSSVLVSPELKKMYCQRITFSDSFVPTEICVAQCLMLGAITFGGIGKIAAILGLREAYFNENRYKIHTFFSVGAVLNMSAALCIIISVAWNWNSVIKNHSIDFPSYFNLPSSPDKQEAGAALPIGVLSVFLLVISGSFLLMYHLPQSSELKVYPDHSRPTSGETLSSRTILPIRSNSAEQVSTLYAVENENFNWDEHH
ncbi:claudin-34 [Latimeria chalumnae]|uniref:Claudin 34 n=1 Tax=Latimeria chalumnae TaxID=7897 RepID=M3XHP4_LATCH|nr:PREDICTED: claudin-34 [Latimeria chalumnae]XP_014339574.1 PREDICTED: claudin-34 [Latimeria chalumnae]XP_014339575.1 PREDICTED: claudin-34 [Latimeria chalumnae]XP_014339576.1 PREDICTED: claudin-34 [Latimeria chalumnae]XP_014339577.1 PREDICTED: claudin-34 [Latimeria chalumnae]XP_014339578.1 PREDICTED: claudin-34 [Latimeria chalumnae]|eukprot:XP_006013853.1 PREDICTED: claudin-34 [Latimeria chalumnae]